MISDEGVSWRAGILSNSPLQQDLAISNLTHQFPTHLIHPYLLAIVEDRQK